MDPMKLSKEEQMRALSLLLFLKEKQIGKVKGWACLNGAPQRAYISKEDAVLPTVSTVLTFITAAIAASERQTIQCCDVLSVFVNTDVNKDILMVLKGELADMMIQKKEILQAQEARRAQAMLGNPSKKDYKGRVSSNVITNCPVLRTDVANAQTIFGPDLASVRGKTVRRVPALVVGDYVVVPRELIAANAAVTLAVDVFLWMELHSL